MTYTYQLFGAMTGWSFLYGCMLGMALPATYAPERAKAGSAHDNGALPIGSGNHAIRLDREGQG